MRERRVRERRDGLIFGTAEWESLATKEQARVWRAGSAFGEHVIPRIGCGVDHGMPVAGRGFDGVVAHDLS